MEKSHWNGKKWYAYGTSMTAPGSGKYAPYLAEISGLELINGGEGGRGITENLGGYSSYAATRYNTMTLEDGKADADLITVEVGPNDTGAPLGTVYDTGNDTLCGCLNQVIRYLQTNTDAQIAVMSMCGSRFDAGKPDNPVLPERIYNSRTGEKYTVFDMVCRIRDVAQINSVYYIPVNESCGLGFARKRTDTKYVLDQIHLSDLGGYNVARFIWSRLRDIPLWYKELPEDAGRLS